MNWYYKTPEKVLDWIDSIYKTNECSLIVVVDYSVNDNPCFKKEVLH